MQKSEKKGPEKKKQANVKRPQTASNNLRYFL